MRRYNGCYGDIEFLKVLDTSLPSLALPYQCGLPTAAEAVATEMYIKLHRMLFKGEYQPENNVRSQFRPYLRQLDVLASVLDNKPTVHIIINNFTSKCKVKKSVDSEFL